MEAVQFIYLKLYTTYYYGSDYQIYQYVYGNKYIPQMNFTYICYIYNNNLLMLVIPQGKITVR